MILGRDLDLIFLEEEDRGKTRNHRTYIGPGADGSSDDKNCVEVRYDNANTKVSFSHQWNSYVKTVFAQYRSEIPGTWECVVVDAEIAPEQ
eukprot:61213-Karenia_brevis.AAC.1